MCHIKRQREGGSAVTTLEDRRGETEETMNAKVETRNGPGLSVQRTGFNGEL